MYYIILMSERYMIRKVDDLLIINFCIFIFNFNYSLWFFCFNDILVIVMWVIFICFFIFCYVFFEGFFVLKEGIILVEKDFVCILVVVK